MKKNSLIKLNRAQLSKKQQQLFFGGNACRCGSCGVYYEGNDDDNKMYNYNDNITSTGTNNPVCRCTGFDLALQTTVG